MTRLRRQPIIGLTGTRRDVRGQPVHTIADAYAAAIQRAGGVPLLLLDSVAGPTTGQAYVTEQLTPMLQVLDGLVLSGGDDLDPRLYGEWPQPALGRIEPLRDQLELALTNAALAQKLPLLAICRGLQVLTIAGGGQLYQDLPSDVPERIKHEQQAPRWFATHPVTLATTSRMAELLAMSTFDVNSFHHQAVKALSLPFVISGWAPDGVIEAIELPTHPFCFGVQWHPEAMAAHDPVSQRLFTGLVTAAIHYREDADRDDFFRQGIATGANANGDSMAGR